MNAAWYEVVVIFLAGFAAGIWNEPLFGKLMVKAFWRE
jgi:hypothetical protein